MWKLRLANPCLCTAKERHENSAKNRLEVRGLDILGTMKYSWLNIQVKAER